MIVCFSFQLCSASWHPLCPCSCFWWAQLSFTKAHPLMGSGPNLSENWLEKVAALHDLSGLKPMLCEGGEHGSFSCPWLMGPCHPPLRKGLHTLMTVLLLCPGSGSPSLKTEILSSLEYLPPVKPHLCTKAFNWEQLTPGWGTHQEQAGQAACLPCHITLSFDTLSAAAHLHRMGMRSPAAPWRSHGRTPGAATHGETSWVSTDSGTPLTFSNQRG